MPQASQAGTYDKLQRLNCESVGKASTDYYHRASLGLPWVPAFAGMTVFANDCGRDGRDNGDYTPKILSPVSPLRALFLPSHRF